MTNLHADVSLISLVFIVSLSIGMFLSLILFVSRKGNARANKFLSLLILLFSIVQIWDFLMYTRLILRFPHMLMIVNPLILLLGPFVYFYVKALTSVDWKYSVRLVVHFIPTAAYYVFFLPFYFLHEQEKFRLISDAIVNHKFIIPRTFYIIAIIQILIYLIYSIRILLEHSTYIKNHFSFTEHVNLNWLKRLLIIFILLWLAFALRSLYPIKMIWEFSAILSVLSMYVVGYFGYNQPAIFEEPMIDSMSKSDKKEIKKYASSPLTEKEITEYLNKILVLMKDEKMFLKNDLKIGEVAAKVNVPLHYVSQIINEKLGKNFYDFINEFRVDEAKKRLADTTYNYLTILAIGFDSGFNSKTAFYSAFKKISGMNPSEYKKHYNTN
jgi:AraC-like DNA-binding protein